MSSAQTIILVTGANSGVGYSITKIAVKASANLHVIMASRSLSAGESAKAEIEALPGVQGSISTMQLDVTDPASITKAVAHVQEKFGRLDVLINNAGMAVWETDDVAEAMKRYQTCLMTNAAGPAIATDAFENLLLKSSNPYLIHISSVLGSLAVSIDPSRPENKVHLHAYRMSKAAVGMLAVQHHIYLAEKGIKVFAVCPGFVVTNLRGKDEASRSGGGFATDPDVSGQTVLEVFTGKRDQDVGKFVHKDGVYGW